MDALIVWGGWDGHEPDKVADFLHTILEAEGFHCEVSNDFNSFLNLERFEDLKLIVPVVTMSSISPDQCKSVCEAVSSGVGIAGCHGGMCDSFRESTEWQFLTGGQWVAHPGDTNVRYVVQFDRSKSHPISAGLQDFEVTSEQYYLHTDPGNNVLASTKFPHPEFGGPHAGNPCAMPQVWTKSYGTGRVFYFAVGHRRADLEPATPREVMRRGMLWAAGNL